MGRTEAATCTDHVIPHRGDMAVFWDSLNWQPACEWHHTKVKQKLEALFDQGLIDASSLWLNSEKAKQISDEFSPRGGI